MHGRPENQARYGSLQASVEDAIQKGQKVLIVDDVLATGGTMEATCQMVEKLGGQIIGISFLIELDFLKGKEKLNKYQTNSLINYE